MLETIVPGQLVTITQLGRFEGMTGVVDVMLDRENVYVRLERPVIGRNHMLCHLGELELRFPQQSHF